MNKLQIAIQGHFYKHRAIKGDPEEFEALIMPGKFLSSQKQNDSTKISIANNVNLLPSNV